MGYEIHHRGKILPKEYIERGFLWKESVGAMGCFLVWKSHTDIGFGEQLLAKT